MNLKRTIDRNYKLIFYIALVILFGILIIRLLNHYSKQKEEDRQLKLQEIIAEEEKDESEYTEEDFAIESNSIEKTMMSFIRYCNEKQIDKAYQMLTDECKDELYPTINDFEEIYVNKTFYIKRDYEMKEWSISGNTEVYLVTLYEDILATGGMGNVKNEYYTFSRDENSNYKLSVENYICRQNRNKETTIDGIKLKIGQVDIYSNCQEVEFTITNETSKKINLTGNALDNIILQNYSGTTYSALNSEYEYNNAILSPKETRTFNVKFNKYYDLSTSIEYLTLLNVIMDYEDYLQSENKAEYSNIKTIQFKY